MANKIKKLFVIGSAVSCLFMAVTACNFNKPSSSSQNNSSSSSSFSAPSVVSSSSNSEVSSFTASSSNSSSSAPAAVLGSITAVSNKDSYSWGEDLDITVTGHYSDNSEQVINDYEISGFDSQVPGEQTVTVTYEEMTCTVIVNVNNPRLVNITAANNQETYAWGDNLNITVTAHYEDGSSVNVVDYTTDGYDKETAGEQNVTISYQGFTCSLKVLVDNPKLVSISAVSNKEDYEWGEDLDIIVTARYEDGSIATITNYEVEGYDKETSGEQSITIKYENQTCSLKVLVNNPKLVSISAVSNKDSYDYGEQLDIVVEARYSDGSTVVITDYELSGYDSENPGLQNLTISYEGKTCFLQVSVKERINLFPLDELTTFLQVENIIVNIPSPIGYYQWDNKTDIAQDSSKYFEASTKDNGTFGVDSIADQYAVALEQNGWSVERDTRFYTALKDNGDALLSFKTENALFSLRVEAYCEFPDSKYYGTLIDNKNALKDGDVVVMGDDIYEYLISDLGDGFFNTEASTFENENPNYVKKNVTRFTLNKVGTTNNWTLTDAKGRKLGATGPQQLVWDEGSTEWMIITLGGSNIIVNATKTYGRICYDPDQKVVGAYKSVAGTGYTYPELYRVAKTSIVYPTAISLKGNQDVGLGKKNKLSIEYTPSETNSVTDVTWSSSNEQVATVKNGIVIGLSVGQATITAQTKSKNDELKASFVVEVKETVLDKWTIMIYMCGSDLESGYYHFASSDIREILSVNGQPDDVNIIMETGGARSWNYGGIDANALSRYHVENRQLVLDQKLAKESMGKQSTLESFLNWGLQEYPADRTGLIFWNHGGAIDGCCFDENFGYDGLTNSETSKAFKNVFTQNGIDKLDFVGYDACLMQIQDVAEFNSKYFDYMIGSEEAEDGYGWDYDNWLDDVYLDRDIHTIMRATCNSFVSSCGESSDQCLSYLDLSNMAEYHEKFEAMASAIKDTAKNNYSAFKSIVNSSKRYTDFSGYGVTDGLDFLNKLGNNSSYSAFQSKINDAKAAYNKVVVYSKAGTSAGQTHGLAVIAATSSSCSYPSSETSFTNWRSIFK